MQTLESKQFRKLEPDQLEQLQGGKWHQETKYYPETGESWLVSYRTNIFGKIKEYGEPKLDN